MANESYYNELIHETSPYLLQHANNPVHWLPWGERALSRARTENRLLIISIGYSACHWCHVMEHECFEDEEAAAVMNANFVSVKVDREERPDVDQAYMNALQLMNGNGGWPLNIVALPDGRPIWGATYVPKMRWIAILDQLSSVYRQKPGEVERYADEISRGMAQFEPKVDPTPLERIDYNFVNQIVDEWAKSFDKVYGGANYAPKFPLPAALSFLLDFGSISKKKDLIDHVKLTLDKMSFGGIYDQVEGGFSRYAVDTRWHIPHFEKMLYDNAQLIGLYSKAYRAFGHQRYLQVVNETIGFFDAHFLSESGGYMSALDADSEGVEGKFYVWTESELRSLLASDYDLFAEYFNINDAGHWEHGHYVLLKTSEDEAFASTRQMADAELKEKVIRWKQRLAHYRAKRVWPGLDNKILTSWNALMISGLAEAWKATGVIDYKNRANRLGEFILQHLTTSDYKVYHQAGENSSAVVGHLDDYSFVIRAFLDLFQVTLDNHWFTAALKLTDFVNSHFRNTETGLYYFVSDEDEALFTRTTDIHDNVMPSGNAVMALNLLHMGIINGDQDFLSASEEMTTNVVSSASRYPSGFAGWLGVLWKLQTKPIEVVVTGANAGELVDELNSMWLPDCYIVGSTTPDSLPVFKGRTVIGKNLIYVCHNGSCRMPVSSREEFLKEIERVRSGFTMQL